MKTTTVLIVLISLSDLVSSRCELDLGEEKEKKLTKFQQKSLDRVKIGVKLGCQNQECSPLDFVDTGVQRLGDTGCRCNKELNVFGDHVYDCRCCIKASNWDILVCVAAALELAHPYQLYLFVTIEDQVVARFEFQLAAINDYLKPVCIPGLLPFPLSWLSPCFQVAIVIPSKENNNIFKLCGKLHVGLYLFPVFTIYTHCFEVPFTKTMRDGVEVVGSVESMKMDAEKTYDEELKDPVKRFKVDERASILALMCVTNRYKREAIDHELHQHNRQTQLRDLPPKVTLLRKTTLLRTSTPLPTIIPFPDDLEPIEIKEKINWRESKTELSPFLVYLHTNQRPIPVYKVPELKRYPFLKNFSEELRKVHWMPEAPPDENNYPGLSCGGALLTDNKVLTICACIRSFYCVNKLKKIPKDEDEEGYENFLFDMHSTTEIYVHINTDTTSPFRAKAKEDYRLETDGNKMVGLESECARSIKDDKPEKILRGLMMVMPFTPKLKTEKDLFVSWPPGDLKADKAVTLVAYGMEPKNDSWIFRNASGGVINFHTTAVDFFVKQCDMTEYCKEELPGDTDGPIKDRMRCLCPEKRDYQLVEGQMGYPITMNRQLLGLSSLPVDSDDNVEGSTAGVFFDATLIKEIETYMAKDKVNGGTHLPHPINPYPIVCTAVLLKFTSSLLRLPAF